MKLEIKTGHVIEIMRLLDDILYRDTPRMTPEMAYLIHTSILGQLQDVIAGRVGGEQK